MVYQSSPEAVEGFERSSRRCGAGRAIRMRTQQNARLLDGLRSARSSRAVYAEAHSRYSSAAALFTKPCGPASGLSVSISPVIK